MQTPERISFGACDDIQWPVPFKEGEALVIVLEDDLFPLTDMPYRHTDAEFIAKLQLTEIIVTEQYIVEGSIEPSHRYYGYKGTGSDGYRYSCDWPKFNQASSGPYTTWTRLDESGKKYVNRQLHQVCRWFTEERRHVLINHVNAKFPNVQYAFCKERWVGDAGMPPFAHSRYGPYLKIKGCFYCNHYKEKNYV